MKESIQLYPSEHKSQETDVCNGIAPQEFLYEKTH